MEIEEMRRSLLAELEGTAAALGDDREPLGEGKSREQLLGYADGLEYALGLIDAAPPAPSVVEDVAEPRRGLIAEPEPELVDQVERVRNTET